ncbi:MULTISPECIES: class I SAM-dependent methyltransferase [Aerococcus]|uniref:Class I SAM-dependent methyltransferase n=1 Tax=Aerococcus sanguinicola TaxID=119206 RepID=A0A5N1GSM5_9LACT|nr:MULTISPECIES: class I SAM-dependent methyltransferase [Aerococcus]KAA9301670.1 class I SAM-dependent methyltransferase [Aerococcus sanguinicola]MDK6368918.1 class I SAM-dependent methyltransferase [Aerococcus sp. UMB9870]MDK6680256.1 class I SAM-dependent methyltransferase [Aerococcus sp. UMB8608]MDK6687269.1 class I SAM-dependent methyltransferase [Aerococcus sp. UMB8623]MDK6940366.1 class I SAM-dependent methyltransferase [Aerococcus sp. UMB8487]
MSTEHIQAAYDQLNQANQVMMEALDFSYTEAWHENLQNIANGVLQVVDGQPDAETAQKIQALYDQIKWTDFSASERLQVLQLIFLEAERQDQLQANHQMTPPGIAILLTYFANRLLQTGGQAKQETLKLFDPTVGTGNLLLMLERGLEEAGYHVASAGYDNDDLLLAIADQSFKFMDRTAQLYYGDVLQNLLLEPVDLVVADLPVGYYPLDERAKAFKANTMDQGSPHAYAHYLMIEQSLNYMKEGAWGIFLVPTQILQEDYSAQLVQAIAQSGYFQAFLNLPAGLFRQTKARKSVLLVQKQGPRAKQAENVLIGDIPDLKDQENMEKFIDSFSKWSQDVL